MKNTNFKRLISIMLCLCMVLTLATAAFAADTSSVIDHINTNRTGSITIHKIDFTNAAKDGVWDTSYVSTGRQDTSLEDKLITSAVRAGDTDNASVLGNSQTSYGYSIKGVEFTYLKVADIVTVTESRVTGDVTTNNTQVLYGFDAALAKDLLEHIGLGTNDRYIPDSTAKTYNDAGSLVALESWKSGLWYFESDTLVSALRTALANNATTVKNDLEYFIKTNNGTAMDETDSYGKTSVSGLPLGLYLIVETRVPEEVTNTTDPFFVSVPTTSVNGGGTTTLTETGVHSEDGGDNWIYDLHLYPKNETGIPSLEKTVRETMADTGENNNTEAPTANAITDGFAHTATASAGDTLEYQIITTLPAITSDATALSHLSWYDTLSKGLTYDKDTITIQFFSDEACTDLITTWVKTNEKESPYFTVTYNEPQIDGSSKYSDVNMTIQFTEAGLKIINTDPDNLYTTTSGSTVRRGFSDCTVRITYTATLDSDSSVTFGDAGNDNKVILTWKRTNNSYYDTLVDDCHVYTYGIDLTKEFKTTDDAVADGTFSEVEFVLWNESDGYWVEAELNEAEGVYYVTNHMGNDGKEGHDDTDTHVGLTAEEDAKACNATVFKPLSTDGSIGKTGQIIIKGLEDDDYVLTEINTDNGYTLLKDHIYITISTEEIGTACDIYDTDVLGLVQNDARYLKVINASNAEASTVLGLGNTIPQTALAHYELTASATVDGNATTMVSDVNTNADNIDNNGDEESDNALVSMKVVNTRGFDLPRTGDNTAMWMGIVGAAVAALAAFVIVFFFVLPKRKQEEDAE